MIGLIPPEGWTEYRLGDIAEIDRDSVLPASIQPGTNYLGLEHLGSDGSILSVQQVGAGELASNKFRFTPEHILYGKLRPYLAKIVKPTFEGVCSTDILPLRPKSTIDRGYLFHYLRHPRMVDLASMRSEGANLPRLSPTQLERFPIFLPPQKCEQERIAYILDKADAIRRKRRDAIGAASQFPVSIFHQSFTLSTDDPAAFRPLNAVAQVVSGVTKGRRFNGATTRTVPYLRVANVQDGHLDLAEIKTIEALPNEISALALKAGDVVMTEGGDYDKLGRGAMWENAIPECIHQNHVFRVRLNQNEVLPEFFTTYLRTSAAKAYFLRCAKKTTNLASINSTQLKGLPVPVVPIKNQQAFVALLNKQGSLMERFSCQAECADELFDSLIQRAFRGDL